MKHLIRCTHSLFFYLFLLLALSCQQKTEKEGRQLKKQIPPNGFVPNKQTASKIAEAILLEIYGEEILNQIPFQVLLLGDSVWAVRGMYKEPMIGGVVYIEIKKSDGEILKVNHSR